MIRADVIYTGEYLRDSHRYNNRKQTVRTYIFGIAEIVFLTAVSVWALSLMRYGSITGVIKIALVINIFSVIVTVKKLIKQARYGKELEKTPPAEEKREYFFGEDRFVFVKRGTISEVKREFAYHDLYAATETNKYFYIHLYKNLVCIIGKNDFTEGSADELRALLIRKMIDKFLIDTEGGV